MTIQHFLLEFVLLIFVLSPLIFFAIVHNKKNI